MEEEKKKKKWWEVWKVLVAVAGVAQSAGLMRVNELPAIDKVTEKIDESIPKQ